MKFLERKGQGAFEYILILAGVLLIVVLAVVILRGGLGGNTQELSLAGCQNQLAKWTVCYTAGTGVWDPTGALSAEDTDDSATTSGDPSVYKCNEYNAQYINAKVLVCGPAPGPA